MAKKIQKTPKKIDPRTVIIPGEAIARFKATKRLSHAELAALLGVNPATLSRWVSDKNNDMPTSTTFLVLIPLLLGMGQRDLMPKYYEEVVKNEFETVFGAEEMKGKLQKFRELAYHRFLTTNPDLRRARALFEALQEAWKTLDSQISSGKK
jgi:transcriptional regulator with XRE-family HTH domain